MSIKFNQTQPVTVSWKLAAFTLWVHAFKCNRITMTLLLIAMILGFIIITINGINVGSIPWMFIWDNYKFHTLAGLLFVHFVPVNIFVIRSMMRSPFYGDRYLLALCKTCNEETLTIIKDKISAANKTA